MSDLQPARESRTFRNVAPRAVYDVVVDFEAYPRIFPEIAAARILEKDADRVRAEFRMNLLLPIRYVIDLRCDPAALSVTWTFVEGDVITGNEGGWQFSPAGPGDTQVDYRVVLQVNAPLPAFVLRKVTDGLVKLSLPGMFAALERETVRRAG